MTIWMDEGVEVGLERAGQEELMQGHKVTSLSQVSGPGDPLEQQE